MLALIGIGTLAFLSMYYAIFNAIIVGENNVKLSYEGKRAWNLARQMHDTSSKSDVTKVLR